MSTSDLEPKKKRRQNVACDSCKFRRIKCDLTELLASQGTSEPSSSTSVTVEPPALHVLIRENPNVECSNCQRKGVKCTMEQILNPTRPNKGGRRIEEARKRFGPSEMGSLQAELEMQGGNDAGPVGQDGDNSTGSLFGIDWAEMGGSTLPPMSEKEFGDLLSGISVPTSNPYDPITDPPWDAPATTAFEAWFNQSDPVHPGLAGAQQEDDSLRLESFPGLLESTGSRFSTASAPSTGGEELITGGAAPDISHQEVARIWLHLHDQNTPSAGVPPTQPEQAGPRFMTDHQSGLEDHLPKSGASPMINPDVEFDATRTAFISRSATERITSTPRSVPTPSSTTTSGLTRQSTPISIYLQAGESASNGLVPGRKRLRGEISPSPEGEDPWKIWEEDDGTQRMVRWGRREAVQQQLADRALGTELSKHLVQSFFHCVHPSFPSLSPEGFFLEWERAGRRSDRMTPAQEALCAVMEAWGARYSDSPVVLGLPPSKAALAPKVVQPDGTLAPGSQARAYWGRARLGVCNALMDRARKLIDQHGLMRAPSVTGIQALLLYNQMLQLTDQPSRAAKQYMESVMIQSTVVEQLKLLQLMWDSTGEIPSEEGELPSSIGQMRMKQRRIFWTVVVSDAFNAAASGEEPRIPDDELESVAKWISDVEAKLPLSTFKMLAFFLSCYHRLSLTARLIARRITKPNRKPGTVNVDDFAAALRHAWAQVKSIHRDITEVTAELLLSCKHSLIGFSPVHYITNLRLSCPFLLLVMHQALREQLDFRKNLRESFIVVDSPPSSSESAHGQRPESRDTAILDELHFQSVDMILDNCRNQMYMYQVILPTGMVQSAAIFLRVLIASVQFLAEVPTVEQGYPSDTLGGHGWTWDAKQKEVNICVDALYQLGWAWADVSEALEGVMLSMERMTPTKEELDAYAARSPPADQKMVVAKQAAESKDQKLFSRAMGFWPIQSVPKLIEDAMNNLSIQDNLDLTSPTVPWEELRALRQSPADDGRVSEGWTGTAPADLKASLARMGQVDHDLASAADMLDSVPWRSNGNGHHSLSLADRNGQKASDLAQGSKVRRNLASERTGATPSLNLFDTDEPAAKRHQVSPNGPVSQPAGLEGQYTWTSGPPNIADVGTFWDFNRNTWIDFHLAGAGEGERTAAAGAAEMGTGTDATTASFVDELSRSMENP